MTDSVTLPAHAKANLFLRVLARETSGYHQIETLFTLLALHDTVTVERTAGGIELAVEGAETGPSEQNLAWRAAAVVLEATGQKFGVAITLAKRIPVGGGLGGGSSDGAAALHAVNRLAGGAVPTHEILQFAARLGSDVPFFASRRPFAMAWGRGERLFALTPPPAAPALLVVPPFGVDTAKAYQSLDAGRPDDKWFRGSVVLEPDALATWGGIGRLGGNDFEPAVFGKEPALRDLFERVARTGPLLARLSGSGSSLIAVYRNERERDAAAEEIGSSNATLIPTTTLPGLTA